MTIHKKQDLYNKEDNILVFCRKFIDNTARTALYTGIRYILNIKSEYSGFCSENFTVHAQNLMCNMKTALCHFIFQQVSPSLVYSPAQTTGWL